MKARLPLAAGAAIASFVTVAALAAPANAVPGYEAHTSARHVAPLQAKQVRPALRRYRAYVRRQIAELVPDVDHLTRRLSHRDRRGAESAWLVAHLRWLRIGQDDGAYGIFGDLGRRIDGTAAGYRRGVNDPSFTGFHRVEHDLWARKDIAAATRDAVTLERLVRRLPHVSLAQALPNDANGASTFILRSHEIIEDAVRDTLSGDDEYGSGTALASITADVSATREVLKLLAPLIKPRSPHLVANARHDLNRLDRVVQTRRTHGQWIAIARLTRDQRQRIDAAAGAADEDLAPVPDLLRIGNT